MKLVSAREIWVDPVHCQRCIWVQSQLPRSTSYAAKMTRREPALPKEQQLRYQQMRQAAPRRKESSVTKPIRLEEASQVLPMLFLRQLTKALETGAALLFTAGNLGSPSKETPRGCTPRCTIVEKKLWQQDCHPERGPRECRMGGSGCCLHEDVVL